MGEARHRCTPRLWRMSDGDISRITTYRQPDERMYAYSVDQALASGKPMLLEFATPAHCTPAIANCR